MIRYLAVLLLAAGLAAQTTINGSRTILGAWDASGATSTRPALIGTAAPTGTDCDAAGEVGRVYIQTGDPATVAGQSWVCRQTGAAAYSWQPLSYQQGTAAPATCVVGQVFFDTDASAGSNWYGCTAANTWTAMGAAAVDNQTIVEYRDDFHHAGAAIGDGVIGLLGWQRSTGGGGTQGSGYVEATESNHPGILELFQAGTPASGHGTCAYLGSTGSTLTLMYDDLDSGTARPWHVYITFKLVSAADVAFYAGFATGANCTLGAGDNPWSSAVMVRYDTGLTTPDSGTGKFRLMNCATSTCTATPSSISADTSWHTAHLYSTADGVMSLSIDGETAVTLATTVPGAVAVSPLLGSWTRTTTSKSVYYDLFRFKQTLSR